MKLIQLTKGYQAIIDDEDFESVSHFKWYAQVTKSFVYAGHRFWKGKLLYLHRLVINAPDGLFVDHINGNTLDCQKSNLRLCNNRQNQANQRKIRGKVGFKGVILESGKWRAKIRENGKRKDIGLFNNAEDAARAYDIEAVRIHGEFAFTNFPVNSSRKESSFFN